MSPAKRKTNANQSDTTEDKAMENTAETTAVEVTEQATTETTTSETPAKTKRGGRPKLEQNLDITVLVEDGKARKLNPVEESHIFYQIGVEASGELYLRISGNETGGLHSKEWVSIPSTLKVLDTLSPDTVFKSTLFKELFQSGSNNNAGFFAAILRSEGVGLIKPGETGVFVHKLATDYEDKKTKLLALADR